MNDLRIVEVGMRVKVFDIDQRFSDFGTIIEVGPLILEDTGEVLSENLPIIRLDSGDELTGFECWWYPDEGVKL